MQYFILNINRNHKSEVDYWLVKKGIAPIFYGNSTIKSIREKTEPKLPSQAYKDAKLFVDTFSGLQNNSQIIFSIGNEFIYFYKQIGELSEFEQNGDDIVKGFKIEILEKKNRRSPTCIINN